MAEVEHVSQFVGDDSTQMKSRAGHRIDEHGMEGAGGSIRAWTFAGPVRWKITSSPPPAITNRSQLR